MKFSIPMILSRVVYVGLNEVKPNSAGLIMCRVKKRDPIFGLDKQLKGWQ